MGDVEGCLAGIAAVVAVVLLLILAWFLIEVAIPAVAFLLYATTRYIAKDYLVPTR